MPKAKPSHVCAGDAQLSGKPPIRDDFGAFQIFERHLDNVPQWHGRRNTSDEISCAVDVLQRRSRFCDTAPMGAQRHFIREWRKHRSLTQEQLAERIGISRPQLSKIEKGARKYDQAFLEAAAAELRIEPADLLVRDPSDPDGLWSIYDKLTPVERHQAVEIIKTLRRTGTGG